MIERCRDCEYVHIPSNGDRHWDQEKCTHPQSTDGVNYTTLTRVEVHYGPPSPYCPLREDGSEG
jgi:hypothetical protein